LRRVHLDPILRALANDQDGVDLQLGSSVVEIDDSEPDSVSVEFQDRAGVCTRVTAQLAIGADGRNSTVAKLKGIKQRTKKNGRFNYAAYFSGPKPDSAPDINGWFGNPQWAGSFPTDSELVGYYIMPTKDRLPQFKQDLEGSIREVISGLPAAPPVDELTLEGKIIGDVELPGIRRERVSGRIALVGDAALTSDPLFGVGCGWAFQSGEWLADAVALALIGDVPLRPALRSYSRRARRELFPHAFQVDNYSSGRRLDPMERLTFKAAARDPQIAVELQRVGTRITKGTAFMRPANQARMVRAQFKSSST
jgi:2-polyprenyl-6-methoxyphenol hydroxylase-like FAD-dependent oxidoreductase